MIPETDRGAEDRLPLPLHARRVFEAVRRSNKDQEAARAGIGGRRRDVAASFYRQRFGSSLFSGVTCSRRADRFTVSVDETILPRETDTSGSRDDTGRQGFRLDLRGSIAVSLATLLTEERVERRGRRGRVGGWLCSKRDRVESETDFVFALRRNVGIRVFCVSLRNGWGTADIRQLEVS